MGTLAGQGGLLWAACYLRFRPYGNSPRVSQGRHSALLGNAVCLGVSPQRDRSCQCLWAQSVCLPASGP